jgi:tyrosyl-tRNA synthetase
MLTAECYKQRMEKGLTFLEFNYMIMQAYDFMELNRRYNCKMEMGGDDQWSNIIAGVELLRRKYEAPAYGLTFTLLTTSEGKKMGKTAKGALWLDPKKTSPYEFYQYWRSINDSDVKKCLSLLTFIPMDEVNRLSSLKDEKINEAKKILAYEVTKMVHGKQEAEKAKEAAEALFTGQGTLENAPTIKISTEQLNGKLLNILVTNNILASKGEGKRLIQQGGISLNDKKLNDVEQLLTAADFNDGFCMVRKGKKKYYRLIFK